MLGYFHQDNKMLLHSGEHTSVSPPCWETLAGVGTRAEERRGPRSLRPFFPIPGARGREKRSLERAASG